MQTSWVRLFTGSLFDPCLIVACQFLSVSWISFACAAGLSPLLRNNATALTVFAPSNPAWARLPAGLVINSSRALGNIMLFHVALGASICPSPLHPRLPERMRMHPGAAVRKNSLCHCACGGV
jgi:hypothetical protein